MTIKTENMQWQDIIALIKNILQTKGFADWNIRRSNQPTMVGLIDKTIYITRVSSRRYGWQAHRDKWSEALGKMIHKEEYIEEVMYQISAFHKRDIININDITSSDVLNRLITYLQGLEGIKALRYNNYEIYRITDLREPPFNDDSDNYEKMPSFDITLILRQTETNDEIYTNEYTFKTERI